MLSTSLAACALFRGDPLPAATLAEASTDGPTPPRASALGPGDVFEARVFQEPDLSGIFRVSSALTIEFPLCGNLTVGGLTAPEVAARIEACLSPGFVKKPQVSVFVREYNSKKVFVFGEVQRPGTFQYEDGMTVIQAITLAGGFTKLAAKNTTSVTRLLEGAEHKVRVPVEDIGIGKAPNFALQPGDIVFVPESLF